jgi:hypothetical protein
MSVRFSIGALLALLALSLLPILLMRSSPTATAGHSGQYVAPGAPWTGSWGYRQSSSCSGSASWSDTVPTGHHYFNGDFGVDYYGCTGTVGRFYSWDPYVPGSNSSHGVVGASPGGSCSDTEDWEGWGYKIKLYDYYNSYRGDYWLLHVHDIGYADGVMWGAFGNPPYVLANNETMTFGKLIGFTYVWNPSEPTSCYNVSTSGGAHWHLEIDNAIGHYACFYQRNPGTGLSAADYLGLAGANTATQNTAC